MPKRGDTREDGKIFWAKAKSHKNGECWLSAKDFERRKKKHRKNAQKYRSSMDEETRKKCNEYQTQYRKNMTDDQRARQKQRISNWYKKLPQDQKKARVIKNAKRLKNLSDEKIKKHKARVRERDQLRYANMTEEQKKEVFHRSCIINKKRYRTDDNYKILCVLRRRFNSALKRKSADKSDSFSNLVGCNIEELRKYLESKFQKGMTWENHGLNGWHIDHIIPCASFDLTDEYQQKVCFHFTNLQPLWASENLQKNAKVEIGAQPNLPI